jgi:iron complex outermembrane receptor protein
MMPPPSGRLGVRHDGRKFFGGVGARVTSRQDRLGDFESPTPGYALADGSLGVRIVRDLHIHTITLRADNAFDVTYRNHLSRTKDIMPEAGRNVSLIYRVTF